MYTPIILLMSKILLLQIFKVHPFVLKKSKRWMYQFHYISLLFANENKLLI